MFQDALKLADIQLSLGGFALMLAGGLLTWMTGKKVLSVATAPLRAFSSAYVLAAVMFIAGSVGIGMGTGELSSGSPKPTIMDGAMSNSDLVTIARDSQATQESRAGGLKSIMDYAAKRDEMRRSEISLAIEPAPVPVANTAPPNYRLGFTTLFGSIGLWFAGVIVACGRALSPRTQRQF